MKRFIYFWLAFLLTFGAFAGLETGDYIDDLVITNPLYNDDPKEGDDHLRFIKKAVKQSFPNISGEVTSTQDELNILDGVTSTTAEINLLDGVTADATELSYNDITTLGTVEASKTVTADGAGVINNATLAAPVLNGDLSSGNAVFDEDDLSSDSATGLATQQSIKAYIDTTVTNYVSIQDQKASGTDGGGCTNGAWRTRTLNTEVSDVNGLATLSSNQITLEAGTYIVSASAPAFTVNSHQARLRNVTGGTTLLVGTTTRSHVSYSTSNRSFVTGVITVAASQAVELQHRCETTKATDGFGNSAGLGEVEVYSNIEFRKID